MKQNRFPLTLGIVLTAALTLVSAVNAQTATPVATSSPPTTQCGFIDVLLADTAPVMPEATALVDTTPVATAAPPPTVAVLPTVQAVVEGGSGEAGGGDEALTTYQDVTQHFRIDYPRSWSQETTFQSGICFTGRDASIAVQFVKGTPPPDLLAYVQADETRVQAGSLGYKQVYLKVSTEVQGAIILGYEWDAGKSIVTEKPIHARTDRYYLVDSSGRLVIVTETEPINQFDPDGVRDTTLTYQVVN